MEFDTVLFSRKSVRKFKDTPLTKGEIDYLLQAAVSAPNACNMQSWHFFVVTDAQKKKELGEMGAVSPNAASAPLLLVVTTDGEAIVDRFGSRAKDLFIIQDTSAAIENILLAATNIGLSGCWMGSFNEEKLATALGIDQKYGIVAVVPIGHAAEDNPKRDRKPMEDVVTYI